MANIKPEPPRSREFRTPEEIDVAIGKLVKRIKEVEELDVKASVVGQTGAVEVVRSSVRAAIRDAFGENSPEFREHMYLQIWSGAEFMNMDPGYVIQCIDRGRTKVAGILNGLIKRLEEKKDDMLGGVAPAPSGYFDRLNLHPRIREVSRDLFMDGHPWDAVFAASKALINYVKERSGSDLDGTPLVQKVFSKNDPVLAFNDLSDKTDFDEQEGMMHLFEGAVLAIRNPGGHAFPEGPEQRAVEYVSFLSLLAYRLQEAKRRKGP